MNSQQRRITKRKTNKVNSITEKLQTKLVPSIIEFKSNTFTLCFGTKESHKKLSVRQAEKLTKG